MKSSAAAAAEVASHEEGDRSGGCSEPDGSTQDVVYDAPGPRGLGAGLAVEVEVDGVRLQGARVGTAGPLKLWSLHGGGRKSLGKRGLKGLVGDDGFFSFAGFGAFFPRIALLVVGNDLSLCTCTREGERVEWVSGS